MADAQGWRAYVGLAKESTFGGFTPATDFTDFVSESLAFDEGWEDVKTLNNSRWGTKRYKKNRACGGGVPFPINVDDNIGLILKDLIGAETYADAESATVGVHTFVPQNALGTPGISMELSKDADIIGNVWKMMGGHVRKLGLAGEAGGTLNAAPDWVFQDYDKDATAQSPGYSTRVPLLWHTGSIMLDGLEREINSLSIEISPTLRDKKYALFSRLIREPSAGLFTITGTITMNLADLDEFDRFIAGAPAALDVEWTADTVGATVLGLSLSMATVYWNSWGAPVSGEGEVIQTINFESQAASAADLLTAVLTNSVAAAY